MGEYWTYLVLAGVLILPVLPMGRITYTTLARARDRWMIGVLALAIALLALLEPLMALIAVAAIAQWKGPEQLPSMVVYAVLIAEWLIVGALPTSGRLWLALGFAAIACLHTVVLLSNLILRKPLTGLLGQRTFSGAAVALTLPFTWPYAAPVAVSGLLASQSWLCWIAGAVALGMLAPWTIAVSVSLALIAVVPITHVARMPRTYHRPPSENTWLDRIYRRGTSIDGLRARWAVGRVLVRHLTWRGRGPGSVQQIITRSSAPSIGHAHCEPLEYLVEYGALGALAIAALVWRVAPFLHLHDPWSAAVVAGAILMLGSTPARVAQVGGLWWAQTAMLSNS